MSNKKYTIGLVIVAIIAVTALFTPAGQKVAGSVKGLTNTNSFGVSDMKVGTLCTDSYEYALCTGMSVDSSGNLSTTGTLQATGTIQTSSTVYAGKQNSTSTTATTYTLVSGDIVGYSVISMTPNTGALTLTLPASSTLATWLPNAGDTTEFTLFNASTTPLRDHNGRSWYWNIA